MGPVETLHGEGERRILPAVGLHLVEAIPRHLDDTGIESQPWSHGRECRERGQIALDQLAAGGIDVGIRRNPVAGCGQQLARGGIDHVPPRREEADVAPSQDIGAGDGTGLEDDGLLALREQMRGGGQADRTRTDDGDGERGIEVEGNSHDQSFLVYSQIA